MTGVVNFYLADKGYGFIRAEEDNTLVFFHRNALPPGREVTSGDRVEYTLMPGFARARALEIRRLEAGV
jgi:cold shock CspA family protein